MRFDIGNFLKENPHTLIGKLEDFESFSINSKSVNKNDLFIAIKGEKLDGHDFVSEAIANGAKGIVVERKLEIPDGVFQIVVADSKNFLLRLGQYARSNFKGKVIGITGSAGKTTTKEMLKRALSPKFRVKGPEGNLNTDISLPIFLLNYCEGNEEYLVLELGIQKKGDMDVLVNLFRPDFGVITNIGESHLEFLGDRTGVLKEKFKLVKYISEFGGTVFLNGDDPLIVEESRKYNAHKKFFGTSEGADIRCEILKIEINEMKIRMFNRDLYFPFSGLGFVYDMLAAFSVALEVGVSFEEAYNALKNYIPEMGRGRVISLKDGIVIIDETYNSNPLSLRTSLSFLSERQNLILVLGDMLELGDASENLHFEVGKFVSALNPTIVLTYGNHSRFINEGILSENAYANAKHFEERSLLNDFLRALEIPANSTIFIKGSRGMKMEDFVKILLERFN